MITTNENKILREKRNTQIRDNFPKYFKQAEFKTNKAVELMSDDFYLSPITIRHIVYKCGGYKHLSGKRINKNKLLSEII